MAENKGLINSMKNLYLMQSKGNGIARNTEETIKYLRIGAKKHDLTSMFDYANKLYFGQYVPSLKKDSTKVNLNGTENYSDSANNEDKDIAELKAEVKSNEKLINAVEVINEIQQINTNTNLLPASVSKESQIKQT